MPVSTAESRLDISQLPSMREGMTAEEESTKRRKTCRFIEEAGRVLKLPRVAVSTAMVFFHRFYAKHSFQKHDRFEVAVAAIVLAAKTEESPKKLNSVIMECHNLKTRGMQAGKRDGSATPPSTSLSVTLDPKGEEFARLKERILLLERVILHTIGFELSIDHPYKFFVEQVKKLIQTRQLKYKSSSSSSSAATANTRETYNKMMTELCQYCMSFANDSMHTSLCLQFSPQLIATACVYLACQFANVEPANSSSSSSNTSSSSSNSSSFGSSMEWKTLLGDPDIESLASICIQIMDLIADRKATETDTFKKIRAQLELLKSRVEGMKSPPPPPPPSSSSGGGGNDGASSSHNNSSGEPNNKRQRVG